MGLDQKCYLGLNHAEIVSSPKPQKQSVSDTSDKQAERTTHAGELNSPVVSDSIAPKQPLTTVSHPTPQLTYAQGATQERRALLKTWLATVIGTAIAFALVSGIKDLRALVTTSMSAGSIAFVVSVLGNSNGNKS